MRYPSDRLPGAAPAATETEPSDGSRLRPALADTTDTETLPAAADTLNGSAAAGSVSVSVVSASAGLSLDPSDGSVSVAAGAAPGNRSLGYRICEIASPANCSQATAYVTVTA